MKEYLSTIQLENIKSHQYKSAGYSKLDYKMNPFWELCAKCLPHVLSYNIVPNSQHGNTTGSFLPTYRHYNHPLLRHYHVNTSPCIYLYPFRYTYIPRTDIRCY